MTEKTKTAEDVIEWLEKDCRQWLNVIATLANEGMHHSIPVIALDLEERIEAMVADLRSGATPHATEWTPSKDDWFYILHDGQQLLARDHADDPQVQAAAKSLIYAGMRGQGHDQGIPAA